MKTHECACFEKTLKRDVSQVQKNGFNITGAQAEFYTSFSLEDAESTLRGMYNDSKLDVLPYATVFRYILSTILGHALGKYLTLGT